MLFDLNQCNQVLAAPVEVAEAVNVYTFADVTAVISCSVLRTAAVIPPPNVVNPQKLQNLLFLPPCPVSVTVMVVDPSVLARLIVLTLAVVVLRTGVMS